MLTPEEKIKLDRERTWIARIMATLMGGPAMAIVLKGVTELNWDTISFGLAAVALAHGWFLILNLKTKE